jgi:hypothetical protein
MPLIGKTYYCGIEGKLKVYDHATSVWVDKSVSNTRTFYDVKTSTTDPNKIIIGGSNELNYSTNAGTTLIASTGDWISYVPTIYQISYTSTPNIIYASGYGGLVKSIDSGLSFNRVNSFTTNSGTLSYTLHFINGSVGIVAQNSKLYKTIDGGASWTVLYSGSALDSTNPTDSITGLHLSADQSTIIATTKRKIFRSTDGGVGFTMVNNYGTTIANQGQTPKYNHLAWLNDNVLINSAGDGYILYSYNAGASWVNATGFTPGANTSKYACTIYQTGSNLPIGFYSDTSNGGVYQIDQIDLTTFTNSLSDLVDKQVFGMSTLVLDVTCYVLTPCSETGNIVTIANSEFSSYVNNYVNIDGSCFYVTEGEDCTNVIHLNYSSVTVAVDCSACPEPEPIYALRDCIALQATLYTTDGLTPGISTYLGQVVYVNGYPNTCWIVVEVAGDTLEAITILGGFETCEECANQLITNPIVYELTNCTTESIIYTYNVEFAQAVNTTVQLTEYSEQCWSVDTVPFAEQNSANITILQNEQGVLQIFEDCVCCLPPVSPEPVKYTRVIPKADRTFYKIAESQCDITANIKFANAYYNIFRQIRYGIASNCVVDEHRILIKKELSDLATLYDPTACVITTPPVPIVCPEPPGNPFIPPSFSFTVGNETGTFNCTQCLDGTNPGPLGLCPEFNITLDYDLLATIDPDATYLFSYNGGCVITLGSFVSAGISPGYSTYPMTASNIVNTGVESPDPCASCAG